MKARKELRREKGDLRKRRGRLLDGSQRSREKGVHDKIKRIKRGGGEIAAAEGGMGRERGEGGGGETSRGRNRRAPKKEAPQLRGIK